MKRRFKLGFLGGYILLTLVFTVLITIVQIFVPEPAYAEEVTSSSLQFYAIKEGESSSTGATAYEFYITPSTSVTTLSSGDNTTSLTLEDLFKEGNELEIFTWKLTGGSYNPVTITFSPTPFIMETDLNKKVNYDFRVELSNSTEVTYETTTNTNGGSTNLKTYTTSLDSTGNYYYKNLTLSRTNNRTSYLRVTYAANTRRSIGTAGSANIFDVVTSSGSSWNDVTISTSSSSSTAFTFTLKASAGTLSGTSTPTTSYNTQYDVTRNGTAYLKLNTDEIIYAGSYISFIYITITT